MLVLFTQIRKFRTLSELIVDAQDYVKNPYKGKKLKVSWGMTDIFLIKFAMAAKAVNYYYYR